jgi:hypothetical protein
MKAFASLCTGVLSLAIAAQAGHGLLPVLGSCIVVMTIAFHDVKCFAIRLKHTYPGTSLALSTTAKLAKNSMSLPHYAAFPLSISSIYMFKHITSNMDLISRDVLRLPTYLHAESIPYVVHLVAFMTA